LRRRTATCSATIHYLTTTYDLRNDFSDRLEGSDPRGRGSRRNHNSQVYARFGRDVGADIPMVTDYVQSLQPLLNRFGNHASLTIILFTLDESTYSRELAPLAGHYPCLRLGPPWWFTTAPRA
jgi:glucuronate isomerase